MLPAVTIKMLPVCPVYPVLAAPFAMLPHMLPIYPAYPMLADPCMHVMAGGHLDRGVGAV